MNKNFFQFIINSLIVLDLIEKIWYNYNRFFYGELI